MPNRDTGQRAFDHAARLHCYGRSMGDKLPESVPLGPRSVLGRIVTDPRIAFTGFATGLLQIMHPAVSAGVIQHSGFFDDPFDRVYRSVPRIVATITSESGAARAVKVRDYHRDIKGLDANGARYHALDPEVFWWTHMCFVWGFLTTAERFRHPRLRPGEREQFYAESVEWWRRYDLSMRFVPPDLASFLEDFDRRCATDLEWTEAAAAALEVSTFRAPFPVPLDRVIGAPLTPVMRLAMIGTLPAPVRERFDLPWTRADRLGYASLTQAVSQGGRLLPAYPMQQVSTAFLKRLGARTSLASEGVPA